MSTISERAVPGNLRETAAPVEARRPTGTPKSAHTARTAASGAASRNWYQPSLPERNRPRSRAVASVREASVLRSRVTISPRKTGSPSTRSTARVPRAQGSSPREPSWGVARDTVSSRDTCWMLPDQESVLTRSVTSTSGPPEVEKIS